MIRYSIVAVVALMTAACEGSASSDLANDESEVKAERDQKLTYLCTCASGACTQDFAALNFYYKTSQPRSVRVKTFFDWDPTYGQGVGAYLGQVDLDGELDDATSSKTSANFTKLASVNAATNAPLAAPPEAAHLVGRNARVDRAMLVKRSATFEGVPHAGDPERIEGKLELGTGKDRLTYNCVIGTRFFE